MEQTKKLPKEDSSKPQNKDPDYRRKLMEQGLKQQRERKPLVHNKNH
jgi:hypothetical protein